MPPRKKSTKKAAPLPLPAHFIQDSWILSDPPEVLPFLEMAQLGEEVRRIDGEMAVHVMWLREQRDFCTKVGRQHGIRLPTSRNSAFGELDHYTVPLASEEPVDPEGLPESLEEDVSSERDTIKKREEKPTAPVATPRSRPLLRQSQIKPEITSPEAQPPVPASPAKSLHIAAARPPPKAGRPQLSHYPVSKLQPEKKKDGISYAFEARIEEATRRKQEQLEKMVEKTRKGNEAKERRVQENLEKIEKKRLEDLQKAEIQQKLAASRSPSRSRLANTATTPTRFKSPARPVLPTPKFISRAKLFDDPPRSVRTPERPHSKQPRMDQLLSAVRSSPAHPSPMRQVARKVPVSTTRKETMKPPKKQAQPSDDALDPQFIENQRRLLMEDEEKTRLREEVRRRLEEEEEEKKRREEDERRRIEEKERLREEQERLRMEEERRRMEENEQAIGPQSPAQDISMEEDGGSDVDAYEMTQDKILIPSTAENYHIEDLDSGDETDDECAPRKKVPVWAEWDNLYKTATAQYSKPNVNYDDMFGTMDNPHNQPIFDNSKMTKRRPRGSSAQWNSPASNPTKGKSRFLGY